MKKIIFILVGIITCSICSAQGLRTIRENFEENKFNWDETVSKDGSVFLVNGILSIENKSEATPMNTICNLPIVWDEDFKVKTILSKPQIDNKEFVGIIFNYEDELNYWVFLVREKEAYIGRCVNGKFRRVRTNPIILKKGNKNDVILQMQKKGRNVIFNVDNMDVKSHPIHIINNTFGFIVYGKGKLNVSSVEAEQYERNE